MGNLNLQIVSAGQTQKEVTINAIAVQLENAVTEETAYVWAGADASKTASSTEFRESVLFTHTGSTSDVSPDFIVPAIQRGLFGVKNNIGQDLTVGTSGQATPPVVVNGETNLFYCDGTSVFKFAGGGGGGSFITLSDAPSAYTGEAGKDVRVNPGETAVEFYSPPYDVAGFFGGAPGASEIIFAFMANRAINFPAGMTGSVVVAKVAATAQTDLDLQKNGSSVGTIRFAIAGTTATYVSVSAFALASGDRLEIVSPGSPDATLADVFFTLAGTR